MNNWTAKLLQIRQFSIFKQNYLINDENVFVDFNQFVTFNLFSEDGPIQMTES